MIAIVQYGAGNLFSVTQAIRNLGSRVVWAAAPEQLNQAEKIILPGVGAFGSAMHSLQVSGLAEALRQAVKRGVPLLGICLGYQLFFESSEESPAVPGLGLFRGTVRRFDNTVRVPQLGWNQVRHIRTSHLFKGIPDGGYFYFANSFYTDPEESRIATGLTSYGNDFVSAAESANLMGVQFHPEKSQSHGKRLLHNFIHERAMTC